MNKLQKQIEELEKQSLQLKALQDAVMALGPQHRRFGTDHQFNFHSKGLQCVECDAMDGHAEDCPVVKLREVLIGQGVSDCEGWEPDETAMYVVEALRWGDREKHSYVVGVYSNKELAEAAAELETDWRGGKYECVVDEYELNKVHESEEASDD